MSMHLAKMQEGAPSGAQQHACGSVYYRKPSELVLSAIPLWGMAGLPHSLPADLGPALKVSADLRQAGRTWPSLARQPHQPCDTGSHRLPPSDLAFWKRYPAARSAWLVACQHSEAARGKGLPCPLASAFDQNVDSNSRLPQGSDMTLGHKVLHPGSGSA